MEPASTKGQNFFPTAITNPLFFFQNKNLHEFKLGASSNQIYIQNLNHNIYSILVILQSFKL